MATIVPTITTDNLEVFNRNLATFSRFSKRIQIDASDGTFAPTSLVPLTEMKFPENVTIDLHLMSARPSDHLARIIELQPALCIIHAEANDDFNYLFSELKNANIKIGVALLKTTLPARAATALNAADHAMIFAGDLGRQGGAIDLLQTEKVDLIRQIKPSLEIGWDGGANLSNVRALSHSDIDVINIGSAISSSDDPVAMYQSLIAESEKKGVLL